MAYVVQLDIEECSVAIKQAFDAAIAEIGIYQGDGPSQGQFVVTSPHQARYVYGAFVTQAGLSTSFDELLSSVVSEFKAWLRPGKTLVWRRRPTIGFRDGKWEMSYRCCQLDDDAVQLTIEWNL